MKFRVFILIVSLSLPIYAEQLEVNIGAGLDLAAHAREGGELDWISPKSWVGIDGHVALSEHYQVLFVVEQEFAVSDSQLTSSSFAAGSHYLGIQANWGRLLLGQLDTVLKTLVDDAEMFADGPADFEALLSTYAHSDEVLAYQYETRRLTTEISVLQGPSEVSHAFAAGIGYQLGPIRLRVATEQELDDGNVDLYRSSIQFSPSLALVDLAGYVLYERQDTSFGGDEEALGASLSAAKGGYTLKLQYLRSDIQIYDQQQWTVGLARNLDTRWEVYGYLSHIESPQTGGEYQGVMGVRLNLL